MSKTELKIVEGVEQIESTSQELAEQPEEFTEVIPALNVDPTSFDARVAGVEPCSVVRELSKHWSTIAAYEVEQEQIHGELKKPEDAKTHEESWEAEQAVRKRKRELWLRKWEPRSDEQLEEHIKYIKRTANQFINWGDIGQLWGASPLDAINLWKSIRIEARNEFISGHYGARAFEVMSYQHEAWRRAQYLAVRDGLIEEWKPRGASEMVLIDTMTQAYVMQIEWTEKAMTRFHGEPRHESYEFADWKRHRKAEAKYSQWREGDWDVPYQHEAEAVEQAFRMADLCQKTFQRALRQLANVRLIRAKTNRMKRRERVKAIKAIKVA